MRRHNINSWAADRHKQSVSAGDCLSPIVRQQFCIQKFRQLQIQLPPGDTAASSGCPAWPPGPSAPASVHNPGNLPPPLHTDCTNRPQTQETGPVRAEHCHTAGYTGPVRPPGPVRRRQQTSVPAGRGRAIYSMRYPFPHTVLISSGFCGSSSTFSRSFRMWTITVLLEGAK